MDIKVTVGDISKTKADAILLGIFADSKKPQGILVNVDKALDGAVTGLLKQGEIKGKLGEVTILHSLGKIPASRVVIVGLGKSKELTQDKIRIAVAETCRKLCKKGAKNIAIAVLGAGTNGLTPQASAQAISEGAILGLYAFRRHITKEPEAGNIEQLVIITETTVGKSAIQQGVNEGKILAEAANLARDMVNEPANFMTPTDMA